MTKHTTPAASGKRRELALCKTLSATAGEGDTKVTAAAKSQAVRKALRTGETPQNADVRRQVEAQSVTVPRAPGFSLTAIELVDKQHFGPRAGAPSHK